MNRYRILCLLCLVFAVMPPFFSAAQDTKISLDSTPSSVVPVVETFLLPLGTTVRTVISVQGREQMIELVGKESPSSVSPARRQSVPPEETRMPVPVKVTPRMPDPRSGLVYRVQVGAFVNTGNVRRVFDRLQAAGFRPAYERHGVYYRVVIPGVRAADMSGVIRRLGSAGFSDAWLREEF